MGFKESISINEMLRATHNRKQLPSKGLVKRGEGEEGHSRT